MFEFQLPVAVTTLDGREILPAGTVLTEQVAAEVAALGRCELREECGLLDYAGVREDLQRFLAIPPYLDIFCAEEITRPLLEQMQTVHLPLPLLKALDYFRRHDFHTYRHVLMVFTLSTLLAGESASGTLRSGDDYMAGPSHDFGKLMVPLQVLKKTGPLTVSEQRLLKHHPLTGYVLLSFYLGDHLHPAVLVARDHHERCNASGYPRGVSELGTVAELVATCDVYDALLSPRPYRPLSYDNRTALEELTRMAEAGALSWASVEALVACNRHGRDGRDQVVVSRDVRGTPPVGNCYGMVIDDPEQSVG
jgi:HD-GYP domain-containing protein (c-di-GMP phosphodiesterase class II)